MTGARVRTGAWSALLVTAVAVATLVPSPASAEGSGGATSRIVGRGDIVTSILGDLVAGGRRVRGASTSTECRWITFSDGQTEYLVAIAAAESVRADHRPVFDVLLAASDQDVFATSDLQGHYCGGTTVDFRLVPRSVGADLSTMLVRQMITRLPAPVLVTSPPETATLPLGEPVFVSSARTAWQPIETTLTADGIVADVRATPVAIRTFSGEPGAPVEQCDGPGRPFAASDPASPTVQASAPDTCTIDHRAATRHADGTAAPGRPAAWIGTVTVLWAAEWRVAPGPWRSLGLIPRTRLIRREVAEVTTSLSWGPSAVGADRRRG